MQKTIIHKNLKFWGTHTTINSIPSFTLAYTHDWNTPQAIAAMLIGISLYASLLIFFFSLPSTQKLTHHPIVSATIKAGTITRKLICLLPIALIMLGSILQLIFSSYSHRSININDIYVADLYAGLISHNFYQSFVDILPFHISDSRLFFPTLFITLTQAFIITLILLIIGLFLSPLANLKRNQPEQARL